MSKRGPQSPRRDAARAAGLSRHQMRQALAVAEISDAAFEQLVESDAPPTVTRLAQIGRGATAPVDTVADRQLLRAIRRTQMAIDTATTIDDDAAAALTELIEAARRALSKTGRAPTTF